MNSISITGRICHTLEMRTTTTGKNVMNIDLAVKRPFSKDTTDFFSVILWEQKADFIGRYAKKGDMVAVSGMMTTRKYEDANGNKRTAFEIVANDVDLMSAKADNNDATAGETPAPMGVAGNDVEFEEFDDEELPF